MSKTKHDDGTVIIPTPPDELSAPLAVKTRKAREKMPYILQIDCTGEGEVDDGWQEHNNAPSFPDVAAAKKHVRDFGLEGSFRVVRVCCTFTAATETRKVTKLT